MVVGKSTCYHSISSVGVYSMTINLSTDEMIILYVSLSHVNKSYGNLNANAYTKSLALVVDKLAKAIGLSQDEMNEVRSKV